MTVRRDLLLIEWPGYEFQRQHLLVVDVIHLNIDFCISFHEIDEIHKPVNFLILQAQLLQIRPVHLLDHLLQGADLFHLENVRTFSEVISLQPARHFVELFYRVLLNHKLVITHLVHAHSGFLVQVNGTRRKLIGYALARVADPSPSSRLATTIA